MCFLLLFLYYGPTIFENAGLSGGDSLFYQVLIGVVNMGTTVLALLIIDKIGRKKLVYYGVSGMIVSLLLIAFYFSFGESLGLSSILMLIFFLLYVFPRRFGYIAPHNQHIRHTHDCKQQECPGRSYRTQ